MQQVIYDDIDRIQTASNTDEVLSVIRSTAYAHGFEHFIVSGLPIAGVNVEPFVLAADWPTPWYERYFQRDYTQFDPVALHCFRTTEPFFWSDAPCDPDAAPFGPKVMNEAADCGLVTGLCVPVHAVDGMQGCVSFGGRELDLDPQTRLGLHLFAVYAHGRLRAFRRPGRLNAPRLKSREIEVLKWAAAGKGTSDIADLLDLSEATVLFHFRKAANKLGTLNRTHSVAEALRYQILPL